MSAKPKPKKSSWKDAALTVEATPASVFSSKQVQKKAHYADANTIIMRNDVLTAIKDLVACKIKVDCIVTSPPFYGQRDYGVKGQIGLEHNPADFINKLIEIFDACIPLLKPTSSVWVNLGDTYWSGRGEHRSGEGKQSARRFGLRPQDRRHPGPWTRAKQLLLIPHRFAIGMQDHNWIVRNDNVWVKPNPIPDQVRDRCSISKEYVFHLVRERFYYFVKDTVGRPSAQGTILPPLDTWLKPPSRGGNGHKASFSEQLISMPIRATCPPNGVVMDPFAGSGTTLVLAKKLGMRAVGIDIKREYCDLAANACKAAVSGTLQLKPVSIEPPQLNGTNHTNGNAHHRTPASSRH